MNYAEIDKEYEQLSAQIKASQDTDAAAAFHKFSTRPELKMTAAIVGQVLEGGEVPMAKIRVELKTATPLSKVRLGSESCIRPVS